MIMAARFRKLVLTAHVVCSVGSLGGVITFFVLAVAGLVSQDTHIVRGAYTSMEITAKLVIMPLIFGSLLTGLVQSLGTTWGLFRHYWVLIKFLLTVFTAIVLLLQLGSISYMADVAFETTIPSTDLHRLRSSLVVHAAGGLLVLLVTTTLSIYKPQGMTRYGVRKQHDLIRG